MTKINMKLGWQERQFIYQWFCQMLGRELNDHQLNAYYAGQFAPLFDVFAESNLSQKTTALSESFIYLQQLEFPRLELAADYAQLFLLDDQTSALPYASAYLNETTTQVNLAVMDQWLHHFQLQTNHQTNEPSDHLCVYLEVLVHLIETENQAIQADFLQQQLMTWLPELVQKAEKVATKTQIYQCILQLLIGFIHWDLSL